MHARHLEYQRGFSPCHFGLEAAFVETASERTRATAGASECDECCAALAGC
jgi:hypothetical protein